MSLLTETGEPLLTESGAPFVTETTPDAPIMRATASLTLTARGRLRLPLPIRATATLTLMAHAFAPKGLGAKLVIIRDKLTSAVLQQYLQVWVHAEPPRLRLSLRIDDAAPVEPPFTRENPNSPGPAVYRINDTELPQDGFTHYLTVSAWTESNGVRSAAAHYTFKGKLAAAPVPLPEWVRPRLIRQNSTELPDLVEIHFRASTAVMVIAQLRKGTTKANVRLGVADRDEGRFLAEGVGTLFPYPDNKTWPIYFGIAGLRQGRESPIRWFDEPLRIQLSDGKPDNTVVTPDTLAGTARRISGSISYNYSATFYSEVRAAVLAELGTLPANGHSIIDQTVFKLFGKIKHVIRHGGRVTLDHFGTFGVSWSNPRTRRDPITGVETVSPGYRQPTFTASPGYQAGTRQGRLLTDEQAKAS